MEPNPVEGLLDFDVVGLTLPNGSPPRFTPFADYKVVWLKLVSGSLTFFKAHLLQIVKVEREPPHIHISQIRLRRSSVLLLIEHLAEAHLGCESCKRQGRPWV